MGRFSGEWLDTNLIVVWVSITAAAFVLGMAEALHLRLNIPSTAVDQQIMANLFVFISAGRLAANYSSAPTLIVMSCAYLMAVSLTYVSDAYIHTTFHHWRVAASILGASFLVLAYILSAPMLKLLERIKPRARRRRN